MAGCTFGKLTSIYCTWYFWKSNDNLYVSDPDVEEDRSKKEVYMTHMRKTLILIIAAIHKKSPNIFRQDLKCPELTPPATRPAGGLTSLSRAVVSLGGAADSVARKYFLRCWIWVSLLLT